MLETSEIDNEMNTLIAKKQFTKLLERAEMLTNDYPNCYVGRWWKARAYTFLGNTEAALNWFIEAMKQANDDMEESKISSSIANVYNIRKDWIQSLNYTEIALELNPDNISATLAKSMALTAIGKREEAHKLLEDKKELFKEEYQQAYYAAIKKDNDNMIQHLAKALKDNPQLKVTIFYDPDFEPYRKNPDLIDLLKV